MADWKKSVYPAIGVLAAIGAFVTGNELRTRQDTGNALRSLPQSYLAGIESTLESSRSVPEGEMFYQLLLLLERDYFDPSFDDRDLAYGAVKGTITGLYDPLSEYLDSDQLKEKLARLSGEYRGAGLELREIVDGAALAKVRKGNRPSDPLTLLPTLEVAMVVPGGPADRLGLRVGDRILGVNGRWAIGFPDISRVRDAQKAVANGSLAPAEFNKIRTDFQRKAHDPVSAARAELVLGVGEGKVIDLVWSRGGQEYQGTLTTGLVRLDPVRKQEDGSYSLRMINGVVEKLSELEGDSILLDLRNSGLGDCSQIKPVLERLAPPGTFGEILTDKPGQPKVLVTTEGIARRTYRIMVDKSTRGAAEILALALQAKGLAQLEGGPMAGEPVWTVTTKLGDGTGHVLNTGRFKSQTIEASR